MAICLFLARHPEIVYGAGSIGMPITCSIFDMGETTSEKVDAFRQEVLFLSQNYPSIRFYVLQEYCYSDYMEVLTELFRRNPLVQMVAVTHYPEVARMSRDEWRAAAAPLCPPCQAVENIDTYTEDPDEQVERAIRKMIDWGDFCICDSEADLFGTDQD